ncbi:ABC transporter substrate-binding protein [Nonomuraea sp. NPDC059023]|uniref:ABC transporter substrate-binding protein n=1 Tax=unclassified Nonomuraea TaxID=2593643 RepID=UPI0036986505
MSTARGRTSYAGSPARVRRRAVISAGLALLALAACGTERVRHGDPSGALTMCTNTPYEPFEFEQEGVIVGFDVDLVSLVAQELRRPLKVVSVEFDSIQNGSALNDGTCDLAAAGITITAERKKNLDFSTPYFEASQAVLVRRDSKLKKLTGAKIKVGVQTGTTGADYAREKGLTVVEYDDSLQQLIGLQAGHVDALIQDRPVIALWLTKLKLGKELKLLESLETGEEYGIAVRKGNTELLRTVDTVLERARKDGTYARLRDKWLGNLSNGQ